jgi:hypothetical protein
MHPLGDSNKELRFEESQGNLLIRDPKIYNWRGRYVSFTGSAELHLWDFQLDAIEIIDMLHNQVKCPKYTKFRNKDEEVCSKKDGRIYRIILCDDYCRCLGERCWCVIHVEPT